MYTLLCRRDLPKDRLSAKPCRRCQFRLEKSSDRRAFVWRWRVNFPMPHSRPLIRNAYGRSRASQPVSHRCRPRTDVCGCGSVAQTFSRPWRYACRFTPRPARDQSFDGYPAQRCASTVPSTDFDFSERDDHDGTYGTPTSDRRRSPFFAFPKDHDRFAEEPNGI